MRGVLEKVPGVRDFEVEAGKADIKVSYDPSKTSVDAVLAGMKAGGEPAKLK